MTAIWHLIIATVGLFFTGGLLLAICAYVILKRENHPRRQIGDKWQRPPGYVPQPPPPQAKPNYSVPKFCPACAHLIDQYGQCKCQAAGIVKNTQAIDEVMADKKPAKVKKYRSIDDDWSV